MKNQQIVEAERTKSELLADAKNVISEWQTELQLGLIDEADKASLISWLAYIKELKAIKPSEWPNLSWPQIPVV
ncbi:tail fiber assembly protein [Siccibacter colletis]|uniref:tail fiber assembly protein n=1 Tax=Siccibacter colletis TaxID=1505757 RepID=UPI0028BE009C|nr:tail fiber assembly protein [Siccibacter colletis]WNN49058.1 tail fiber assembly protein [Siccibacter colletis]